MILKQKASKRLLSLFLAVMMCLMIMPTSALAASEVGLETEETQSEETIISSENDEAEATEEIADPEETLTVCNCGTDDMAIHAVGCPVYVTPENPECYCVEKCTEPNLWCDICGFDVTACEGGEDTAAVYQVGDTFEGFLHNTDNRIDYSVTYRFTILSDGTTPDVELTGIVKGTPTELILAGSTYASLATQDKNDLYKIVSIGEKAFYNCTTLTKVNLGNSKVTEVKQSAFEKCTALTSLNLAGVQTIGERAFSECGVTLLNGTALDGVQSIGDEAFNNCTALESLILHASVKEMGDTVFTGCSKLSSLTLRNGITTLGNATFAECSSLTFVSIPDSITVIPVFTFYGCNNLQFLFLSESVK